MPKYHFAPHYAGMHRIGGHVFEPSLICRRCQLRIPFQNSFIASVHQINPCRAVQNKHHNPKA